MPVMKCDFCDQKATVYLTQLIDGTMKKISLCEPCAKERGVTDPTGFSLADLLLGGTLTTPALALSAKKSMHGTSQRACPTCGFTLDDLIRVRRFGCADCYTTFSAEVAQMLRGMHQGLSHVGKVPEGLMARKYQEQRLKDLQDRLDQAVAHESYEEAADLRDEIRSLEAATPSS